MTDLLLIIIKTRGRKVTSEAAATSAAVQLRRKWRREIFLKSQRVQKTQPAGIQNLLESEKQH